MIQKWQCFLAGFAMCIGCDSAAVEDGEKVLQLTACPTGAPCNKVADGQSLVTFTACTQASPVSADLDITFTTSGGKWTDSQSSTTMQRLDVKKCATAALVVPLTATTLRIDASTTTVRATPIYVPIVDAAIVDADLAAVPVLLAADGTLSAISARAIVAAGHPSLGSRVKFEVTPIPANSYAVVSPSSAAIDGTDDTARATLTVEPSVTNATVVVRDALTNRILKSIEVRRQAP